MNLPNASAVLLMAHGSPASLDEIPAYMTSLRGGRPAEETAIAEMRARYAAIGGQSPMLEITYAQAAALQEELRRRSNGERAWQVYVGTRYWTPTLTEALAQAFRDGHRAVLGLCMVPHPSRLTVRAYGEKLAQARSEVDPVLETQILPPWENQPSYLEALEATVREALSRAAAPVQVLFTAHSLPASAMHPDDDYKTRLEKSAAHLAARLDLPDGSWQVCFQCAPLKDGSWLGPYLDDAIAAREHASGTILAVPIGFVSDHLEVLYDLDIEARRQAESLGLAFVRAASLNTRPLLIAALAQAVLEQGAHRGTLPV